MPSANKSIDRYISIKLVRTHQMYNNRVGNDWDNFLSVNKQIIRKEEKVVFKLEKRAPITVEAHAIEKDKHHDDAGENKITFTYSDLIAIEKNQFEIRITVMENGGQNAGNLAKWMYIFEVARENK